VQEQYVFIHDCILEDVKRFLTPLPPEEPLYCNTGDLSDEPLYSDTVIDEPLYVNAVMGEPVYGNMVTEEPLYDNTVTDEPLYGNTVTDEPLYGNTVTDEPLYGNTVTEEVYRNSTALDMPHAPTDSVHLNGSLVNSNSDPSRGDLSFLYFVCFDLV
jgi:hypothetical protein